ncbi:MAG: DUF4038 domain-containing protein [Kiritimatiellae bacterium]|nr:DUF4038 domain-containing protein [Kiritimatiellia bacterium]
MEKLRISDNGRFLAYPSGAPFIWIGDTFWLIRYRPPEVFDSYLDTRRTQGFTIIQTLFMDHSHDPAKWHAYDAFVAKAAERGMYVAVVLDWGDPRKTDPWTAEQLYRHAFWVGRRYRDADNIVWLTLGEGTDWRTPREKILAAVRGLRDGDTGKKLLSLHTIFGTSTGITGFTEHVDFHTWQTNHWEAPDCLPLYAMPKGKQPWPYPPPCEHGNWRVWEAIAADRAREPAKPVLDTEAWYEGDGTGNRRLFQCNGGALPYHVRRRAYFTVLAGACGHTYGAAGVWDVKGDFEQNLRMEGAAQMGHLGKLLESLGSDLLQLTPEQAMVAEGQSDDYDEHVQACRAADGGWALVYIANGKRVVLDCTCLAGRAGMAQWFDPRTGTRLDAGSFPTGRAVAFKPPGEPAVGNDWVLLLASARQPKSAAFDDDRAIELDSKRLPDVG